MMLKLCVALNGGVPLSVTFRVVRLVVFACATAGRHVKIPLFASNTALLVNVHRAGLPRRVELIHADVVNPVGRAGPMHDHAIADVQHARAIHRETARADRHIIMHDVVRRAVDGNRTIRTADNHQTLKLILAGGWPFGAGRIKHRAVRAVADAAHHDAAGVDADGIGNRIHAGAVSSKVPRKPFASGAIAAIWSRAFWMFA